MPIYEYQCQSCDNVVEKWQGLSEAPLTTCPACAGPLKKLISMSSFQLKGGGWYADGYSSTGSSCSAKSSSTSSSSDAAPACAAKGACGGCS